MERELRKPDLTAPVLRWSTTFNFLKRPYYFVKLSCIKRQLARVCIRRSLHSLVQIPSRFWTENGKTYNITNAFLIRQNECCNDLSAKGLP
jgi:hypothetical protein